MGNFLHIFMIQYTVLLYPVSFTCLQHKPAHAADPLDRQGHHVTVVMAWHPEMNSKIRIVIPKKYLNTTPKTSSEI